MKTTVYKPLCPIDPPPSPSRQHNGTFCFQLIRRERFQLAELFFEVDDRDDPIEVNGETEYRDRVVNQGSKNATNVNLTVEMPAGIQAVKSDGPTTGTIAGRTVKFKSIGQLPPRGEAIFKIRAKGITDGDHLVKVMLSSDERREVVAKQESTKVYSEFR